MTIKEKIALFPHAPGVYRYYDSEGRVIYVGKAKDLHKRVAQYFVPVERLNTKTRILVSKIADAQYSVVDSEADALLLENNLIKQYKPRYNILLKDSKTYPWICVSGERFPRVYITRRIEKGSCNRYFGPYSSAMHARGLLEFFSSVYPLRTCKLKITSEAILRKKYRPCLEFHLGRCKGCCVGAVSEAEYNGWVDEIVRLLSGRGKEIIRHYKALMAEAAAALDFELAQVYKDKVHNLESHYAKSIITTASDTSADVFTLVFDASNAFGNFLRVREGAIVQSLNLGFKLNIEEDEAAVLSAFIAEIESKFGALSKEVVVPFLPDVEIPGVEFKVPVRGEKLSLLELSLKNSREFHVASLRQQEHTDPDAFRESVMEDLRKALGMTVLPRHMECFDNSNIQGTNPVASCVVFRNAEPSKKDYRRFKIKTVVGCLRRRPDSRPPSSNPTPCRRCRWRNSPPIPYCGACCSSRSSWPPGPGSSTNSVRAAHFWRIPSPDSPCSGSSSRRVRARSACFRTSPRESQTVRTSRRAFCFSSRSRWRSHCLPDAFSAAGRVRSGRSRSFCTGKACSCRVRWTAFCA